MADRDIILLCNPKAGGRWKELARVLDSDEARHVRRIVTDSIEDIAPALAQLSHKTGLVCIYGGDGTIQKFLDRMYSDRRDENWQLAFIGGGTMNVTARWCGLTRSPQANFREVVRAYLSGQLLLKEVPLLRIQQGDVLHRGFTFGLGAPVRVLRQYESGKKGKAAALKVVTRSLAAAWSSFAPDFEPVLADMPAEVLVDGERLPFDRFFTVFCNITGQVNIGVKPFPYERTRDTFYYAGYAIQKREAALLLPLTVRGWRPIDPTSLLQPVAGWKRIAMSYLSRGSFPIDPRYINATAARLDVRCDEEYYTVDGEIIGSTGEPIAVDLGPRIKLVVTNKVGLNTTMRLAAEMTQLGS